MHSGLTGDLEVALSVRLCVCHGPVICQGVLASSSLFCDYWDTLQHLHEYHMMDGWMGMMYLSNGAEISSRCD